LDLTPEVRQQQAEIIANRVGVKLKIDHEDRPPNEDFLEDVARHYRDGARYH
jgi:ubiquitin